MAGEPGAKWYAMVAARVLERGYMRTGDLKLKELAEMIRREAELVESDFDELVKRVERMLEGRENKRSAGARDPLDALDLLLEQLFNPLEKILEWFGDSRAGSEAKE